MSLPSVPPIVTSDTACELLMAALKDYARMLCADGREESAQHVFQAALLVKGTRRPEIAQRMDEERLARIRGTT